MPVQTQSPDADIAADKDRGVSAGKSVGDGESAIQFHGLGECMFGVDFPGCFPHQAGVYHQEIAGAIELEELNRAADHIG